MLEELKRSNPGTGHSSCGDDRDASRPNSKIQSCKKGILAGCRRVVGLDGCHFMGPRPGKLLVACGINGNNQIYPLFHLEAETKETWKWFLRVFKRWSTNSEPICMNFYFRQAKGSKKGLRRGSSECRASVLCETFMQQLWDSLQGRDTQREDDECCQGNYRCYVFRFFYGGIYKEDEEAYNWLTMKDPAHWIMSHFKH